MGTPAWALASWAALYQDVLRAVPTHIYGHENIGIFKNNLRATYKLLCTQQQCCSNNATSNNQFRNKAQGHNDQN